jgi:hypothetical protein
MTLYTKIGRRYVPAMETMNYDAWSEGDYLVRVRPGGTTTRRLVKANHAALLAALEQHRDALVTVVKEATKLRPGKLSPKEQRAFQAYCDVLGPNAMMTLNVPGPYQVVTALEEALVAAVDGEKQ